MKRFVCAVFDSAVGTFGSPVFAVSVGQILRQFGDEVNRVGQDNGLNQHPEDFSLWLLAMFDDESGLFFDPDDGQGKRVIARGQDLKRA